MRASILRLYLARCTDHISLFNFIKFINVPLVIHLTSTTIAIERAMPYTGSFPLNLLICSDPIQFIVIIPTFRVKLHTSFPHLIAILQSCGVS